jgi:hypothetical protein
MTNRGIGFWIVRRCVRDPRISGGVRVLLRDFNRWLARSGERKCELAEFKSLLPGERLYVIEVAATLLVPGLGLAEDWYAVWGK